MYTNFMVETIDNSSPQEKPDYNEGSFSSEVENFKNNQVGSNLKAIEAVQDPTRKQILMEYHEETYGKYDEMDWKLTFFQNFQGVLPGGYKRDMAPKDPKMAELVKKVDLIIQVEGLANEFEKYPNIGRFGYDNKKRKAEMRACFDPLLKLYIELRKLGYSHREIAS